MRLSGNVSFFVFIRRLIVVAAFAFCFGIAVPSLLYSQTGPSFKPGENPVSNQAWNSVAVSPSDTAGIAVTRALYNGSAAACTLTIVPNGSTTAVAFANLQPGEILPAQAIIVKSTGTTCTGIVAMY